MAKPLKRVDEVWRSYNAGVCEQKMVQSCLFHFAVMEVSGRPEEARAAETENHNVSEGSAGESRRNSSSRSDTLARSRSPHGDSASDTSAQTTQLFTPVAFKTAQSNNDNGGSSSQTAQN